MRRMDYYEYINSDRWRKRRADFLKNHDRCQRCGCQLGRWKQVHHVSYQRLGHELDSDLQALCKQCHLIVEADKGNNFWLLWSQFCSTKEIPKAGPWDRRVAPSDKGYLGPNDCYELSGPSHNQSESDRHGFNAKRVSYGRR